MKYLIRLRDHNLETECEWEKESEILILSDDFISIDYLSECNFVSNADKFMEFQNEFNGDNDSIFHIDYRIIEKDRIILIIERSQ